MEAKKKVRLIARLDVKVLQRLLGRLGETLWRYANGLDDSPVRKAGQAEEVKTVGNSTTLPRDVTSEEEIRRTLLELAESVASRLRHQGMKAGEVQLTVKSGDFQEYQRQCRLEPAVCDARSLPATPRPCTGRRWTCTAGRTSAGRCGF